MKSSIYIAAQQIVAIGYKKHGSHIQIRDYVSYPIPEGTMINGKIAEPAEITESLKLLKKGNPHLFDEASLVIDGNSVITKKLSVPNLKKEQYQQLVREDMADTAENYGSLVFDYSPLETNFKTEKVKKEKKVKGVKTEKKTPPPKSAKPVAAAAKPGSTAAAASSSGKKNTNTIFACATDRLTIESYQNVFDDAKIKLRGIAVGLEAIISFVGKQKELLDKTFVLNVVDAVTMLSIIFENGNYIFSTRTRLIGEDDEALLLNILENLSPLIQFNISQKRSDVTASYYLGLSYEQVAFIAKTDTHSNVEIRVFDIYKNAEKGKKVGDNCYFAFLGALLDKKNINLIESYKNIEKNARPKKHVSPMLIIPLLLVLIVVGVVGYPTMEVMRINESIAVLEEYLGQDAIVQKSGEIDVINWKISAFSNVIKQINDKAAELEARAAIGRDVLNVITRTNSQTVEISEFSFDGPAGIVRVIGSSATQNDSAAYVSVLKESSLIKDVNYTGYSYDSGDVPRFNFAVDVVLNLEESEAK